MAEAVKVMVRCRPMNQKEKDRGTSYCKFRVRISRRSRREK